MVLCTKWFLNNSIAVSDRRKKSELTINCPRSPTLALSQSLQFPYNIWIVYGKMNDSFDDDDDDNNDDDYQDDDDDDCIAS